MSDRQTLSESRHASIVSQDGTVMPVDRSPSPYWRNRNQAPAGAPSEYRHVQRAGDENSPQPTRREAACGRLGVAAPGDPMTTGNRQPHVRCNSMWVVVGVSQGGRLTLRYVTGSTETQMRHLGREYEVLIAAGIYPEMPPPWRRAGAIYPAGHHREG